MKKKTLNSIVVSYQHKNYLVKPEIGPTNPLSSTTNHKNLQRFREKHYSTEKLFVQITHQILLFISA